MADSTKKKKKSPSSAKKAKTKKKRFDLKNKKTVIALCVSVLALAGLIAVIFAVKGSAPKRELRLTGEYSHGIDVSSHNGKIDWNDVKNDADFAFIRVGYRGYSKGEINKDKKADYNLKHAYKNGVAAGVYFYSQAVNEKEAEEEAEFLLKEIKDFSVSLPVVIDFEYAAKNGKHIGRLYDARLSKNERTALINAFCDKIRAAGYTPGIYASSYIYRSELNMKNIPEDVFIWVADYNGRVTYNGYYDIWQYTEKGSCKGINGKVDRNYFYLKNRLEDNEKN